MKSFLLGEFLLRGDVSSVKKQLIAAHLTLTDGEASGFRRVYEQHRAEMSEISGTKTATFKE